MIVISAPFVAFLVSVVMMLVLRPVALSLRMVDEPGGRKSHSGVIPITGGLAIFSGLLVAALAGGTLGENGGRACSLASTFMVLVGAMDDRVELHPYVRLLAHTVAAIVLVYGTGYVVPDLGNLFGLGEIPLGVLALPFTIVAAVALVNAFNMLDGMDGLAGGVGLIALLGLGVIAADVGAVGSMVIALSLVGAVFGFLIFNIPAEFNRALRAFMGDAGSTFLGFVLAAIALVLLQPQKADLSPVVILWLLPIPIFELFTTTFRRLVHGLSPMSADDGHFHHRLVSAGFSVRLIFLLYMLLSAASAMLGLAAYKAGTADYALFAGFLGFYAAWLAFIRWSSPIARRLPLWLRRDVENLVH